MNPPAGPMPPLRGVHHTAFPTWKPRATVEFYRDGLGLPLVHAVTAKGWGRSGDGHPDFVHFFFDAGQGAAIAFFHYIGTEPQPLFTAARGYLALARHTAWAVEDATALDHWRAKLASAGAKVTPAVAHELVDSIYFVDPNGYQLEITCQRRAFTERDARDAALTIEALLDTCEQVGGTRPTAEALWRRKAALVRAAETGIHRAPA